MTPRQKAQQIVDSVRGPVGLTRQQYEEYFVDRITEALQKAANVELPSEDEIQRAAFNHQRKAICATDSFESGVEWALSRLKSVEE
jgi:hypothetical protein